ncbi:MAG: Ig-like domain-containing protein [Planctomycetia bacterium]|nr:Ig-like domain-containing protein [Planctomycetia bacterium]
MISAEVLESRCLPTSLVPVNDAYQTLFGQALVTQASPSAIPTLTLVETIAAPEETAQIEASQEYGLLFTRHSDGKLTVIDTLANTVIEHRDPNGQFKDMDLTPDGRYLFAADSRDGDYSAQRWGHRFDLKDRTWEVHTLSIWANFRSIEALDSDRFLYCGAAADHEVRLYSFSQETWSARWTPLYPLALEYDPQAQRIFIESQSGEFSARRVEGDQFASTVNFVDHGSVPGKAGSFVLSADGRFLYAGQVQVASNNLRSVRKVFSEVIYSSTGAIALGKTGYYSALSGAKLGTLGFESEVYFTSDKGAHVWAADKTSGRLCHYLTAAQPIGLIANDSVQSGTTVELVAAPANGTLSLQPDGSFSYQPGAAFAGTDTFQYRLVSGNDRSAPGVVTITVPQPAARPSQGVSDEYITYAGQTLRSSVGAEQLERLVRADAFAIGDDVRQLEFSSQFHMLVARTQTEIRIYDTDTRQLISTRNANTEFTDMDLTSDGRYLFVADSGGYRMGYHEAIRPHFAHRYDLQERSWEQRPTSILHRIEAVSAERFLIQELDQHVDMMLNDFVAGTELSRIRAGYYGDFEYDEQTGRVYHGSSGSTSHEIHVRTVVGNQLTYTSSTETYGTAQDGGGSSILSTDGRYFFYGDLQVEAADVKSNVRLLPEIIRAATGSVAFGSSRFYDTTTGTQLGQLPFSTDVMTVSDDGRHLWAKNGDQVEYFGIRMTPAGLLANDIGINPEIHRPRVVASPQHGSVTILPSGQFEYVPALGYVGDDTFSYQSTGVLGPSTIANVTIHVLAASGFVARDDSAGVITGDRKTLSAASLKGNDSERVLGAGQVELVTMPQHGRAESLPDGTIVITTEYGFSGDDSIQYRLSYGHEVSESATIRFRVAASSGGLDTLNDVYAVPTQQVSQISAVDGVLANDQPAPSGLRRVELVTPTTKGQLTLRDDGSFDYLPNPGAYGTDEFTYRVQALSVPSRVATVRLHLVAPRFVVFGTQLQVHLRSGSSLQVNDMRNHLLIREGDETFQHQFTTSAEKLAIKSLVIVGSTGADRIDLSLADSWNWSLSQPILILGGDGDDTIICGAFHTRIEGGGGNDSIKASHGDDALLGGDGDDGNDSLEGGSGNDSLNGGDDDDTLVGQTGRDLLAVSPGKDVLQGSTTSFVVAAGGLNWVLANNRVSATFTVERTRITVANTLRGQFGGAILVGNEGNNKLDATGFSYGNVIMYGDAGNDTLIGSPGTDFMSGEAGNDLLDGRGGHDALSGDEGNDTLRGNTGDDSLLGGEGNDSLDGAAGRDSLSGGLGNDTFRDGNGFYWFEDVAISPNMTLSASGIEGFGTDKFANRVLGLIVFGDERNNVIDASAYRGSVTIDGEEGDDTLIGSAFNDVIVGGEGNDNISGADGNDVLLGNEGNDVLSGARGADTLLGQAGHDSLSGGDDADALLGGDGDDTLLGQASTDTLVGGAGANFLDATTEARDQFSFNPAPLIVGLEPPLAMQILIDLFSNLMSQEDESSSD